MLRWQRLKCWKLGVRVINLSLLKFEQLAMEIKSKIWKFVMYVLILSSKLTLFHLMEDNMKPDMLPCLKW